MTDAILAELAVQVSTALLARDGSAQRGDEIEHRCLAHEEQHASASFNTVKGAWKCHACGAHGGVKKLAELLEINVPKAKANARRVRNYRVVALSDYVDEQGRLLFQVERRDPKDFRQRRPDGNGEWIYDLNGVRRVVYRLPDVVAAIGNGDPVLVVEGEKDADRLAGLGLCATCNPMGAGKWLSEYNATFAGADVIVLPDNDEAGRAHGATVRDALVSVARSVRLIELPGLPPKGDVSDWLDAGHTAGELLDLVANTNPLITRGLSDVVALFQRHLYLPDPGQVHLLLAAIVANRMGGEAVWLMFVGASGSGKTELFNSIRALPDVHAAATLTVASLLSGTPRKEHAADSKGGLLRKIGAYGIVLCKDFTSVLSMPRDARAEVLGALRELYDGEWTRHVGAEGGRELKWEGKLAVIAGCTDAIDQYHAVIGSLGERFLFYRLPETDGIEQANRALDHAWDSATMRRELAEAVQSLLAGVPIAERPSVGTDTHRRFTHLAALAARCRTPVVRDSYKREIELKLSAEAPGRIAIALARLYAGLLLIGTDQEPAWRLTVKVALDSMPKLRRGVFDILHALPSDTTSTTTDIATATGYPTQTARRTLEDLHLHGVVDRQAGGDGKPDKWSLSAWTRARIDALTIPEKSEPAQNGAVRGSVPEKSEPGSNGNGSSSLFNFSEITEEDLSGKVPPGDTAVFFDDAGGRSAPTLPADASPNGSVREVTASRVPAEGPA